MISPGATERRGATGQVAAPAQTSEIPIAFARRVALSRAEVSETIGRSEDFVDSLISDGTLRAKRVRKTVFVIAADVWSMLGIGSIAYEPISDEAELLLRRIA